MSFPRYNSFGRAPTVLLSGKRLNVSMKAPDVARAGQALVFLGGLLILVFIGAALLSGPALSGGWEGAWFRPGYQFSLVPPLGLVILLAGLALYVAGRAGRRESP
jgi:hypothetical protein